MPLIYKSLQLAKHNSNQTPLFYFRNEEKLIDFDFSIYTKCCYNFICVYNAFKVSILCLLFLFRCLYFFLLIMIPHVSWSSFYFRSYDTFLKQCVYHIAYINSRKCVPVNLINKWRWHWKYSNVLTYFAEHDLILTYSGNP